MIILVGPSASGKSVVAKRLMEEYNLKKIVTYTTRPMRINEVQDVDYHFISLDDFLNKKQNNYFIETALYNNNYYGTAFEDIGDDKVLVLEPNGANVYYHKLKNKVFIVYLDASIEKRKNRMITRKDSSQIIEKRLANDPTYFAKTKFDHIDLVIETDNLSIENIAEKIINAYGKGTLQ